MPERVYGDRELELLGKVLRSGKLCALDGDTTPAFEDAFARMMGTRHAVAMNCAMSVLHAAVMCAGAGAGSEVICDPIFVFGAQAVLYASAAPRFVDINPDTLEMDAGRLEAAINERTKAVIVTHSWGLPAEMDRIVEIAHRHQLTVIEDCAHAILATYRGRCTGSWGDIGSFSFQGSKQMALGDGGMATVSSAELAQQLDLHAGAPTFHCVAHGLHYNYRMNEITAAVGLAQLERLPELIAGLKTNARYYDQAAAAAGGGFGLGAVLQGAAESGSQVIWGSAYLDWKGVSRESIRDLIVQDMTTWNSRTDLHARPYPNIVVLHDCAANTPPNVKWILDQVREAGFVLVDFDWSAALPDRSAYYWFRF